MNSIMITKEQYEALDNLFDSDSAKYAQFSVSAYKNQFELTIHVECDFKKTIEENPNHRFSKVHAIVPLF